MGACVHYPRDTDLCSVSLAQTALAIAPGCLEFRAVHYIRYFLYN
jgi:hypothetical protein